MGCSRTGGREASEDIPPATYQRIIAIAPNTAEIVCELGAADRLVAVSQYCTYPPSLEKLPKIGGPRDLDLEMVIALQPDLVIARGASEALVSLCDAQGIRVYHDPSRALADIEQAIREIGDLLSVTDRATAVLRRMRERLEAIRRAVADRPRPRVLFTTRNPEQLSSIYTVARGSYLDELIVLAGGENIFGDQDTDYPLVSLEEIIDRRPEVIIESLFGTADSAELRASVAKQWQSVSPIPAVETGRLHILSADYATVPSPRVVLLAADFVRMIHPEVTLAPE
ncbi:MAG: ABC transporter substrate-binding protein [bacterium]|nr:ABC transporter substrate-binding protein [bacterium]